MTEHTIPTTPPVPVLEIVSFLDASTVVLVGHRTSEIEEGDELYILGHGFNLVPVANVPLIAPKAKLQATFPAGLYVLAKTPLEGIEVDMGFGSMMRAIEGIKRVERRAKLTSKEDQFVGDPGRDPVKIGDKVVRTSDLAAYIKYKAQGGP